MQFYFIQAYLTLHPPCQVVLTKVVHPTELRADCGGVEQRSFQLRGVVRSNSGSSLLGANLTALEFHEPCCRSLEPPAPSRSSYHHERKEGRSDLRGIFDITAECRDSRSERPRYTSTNCEQNNSRLNLAYS
ncbi:hypothetical protein R1flu_011474 [Riccia fluitans]|uniref:Uncharacterized protein n=1 Tax=Riccia fluitans TaxID=41844 RepID=A0ABD1Z7X6_9MARC